jgi:hypothetical protein
MGYDCVDQSDLRQRRVYGVWTYGNGEFTVYGFPFTVYDASCLNSVLLLRQIDESANVAMILLRQIALAGLLLSRSRGLG